MISSTEISTPPVEVASATNAGMAFEDVQLLGGVVLLGEILDAGDHTIHGAGGEQQRGRGGFHQHHPLGRGVQGELPVAVGEGQREAVALGGCGGGVIASSTR